MIPPSSAVVAYNGGRGIYRRHRFHRAPYGAWLANAICCINYHPTLRVSGKVTIPSLNQGSCRDRKNQDPVPVARTEPRSCEVATLSAYLVVKELYAWYLNVPAALSRYPTSNNWPGARTPTNVPSLAVSLSPRLEKLVFDHS